MTAPRSVCRNTKKALAERGPSIHDDLNALYRQPHAPGGGGRKWMLYSAAIATTSSGFCSFML
jgi:hypothetical protein